MKLKYVQKIKSNVTIFATKKTSNILDGTYKSIYKGKTLNFEDLREYVIGDNVKDIDWKTSARSNNLLIRQYIAEKKHNIMLVLDSGKKMLADTKENEVKKDVALNCAGVIAYLASKNGDFVGGIYNKDNLINFFPFKEGLFNVEKILSSYDGEIGNTNESNIKQSLEYIANNIRKRMIVFVITDLDGLESIDEIILKKLSILHDVLFINISDIDITGSNIFDMDDSFYFPKMILNNKKLHELEVKAKKDIYDRCTKKLKKYKISTVTVDKEKDSVLKIIELLERHKDASIR